MTTDISILLGTAATIGLVHTLTGPDHYLPFIVMGKARNWSGVKTLWITFVCGLGHVGSSVVIGILGIALGLGINKLGAFESFRGNIAAWAFVIFGFVYFMWGLWKAHKDKPHRHFHLHPDHAGHSNHVHMHEHHHSVLENHKHSHIAAAKPVNLTPWVLFTIFVLGPCEPLIPLLMYPAAESNAGTVALVTLVFAVCTVGTMMVVVSLTLRGINFIPMKAFEKYMHAIAGATICLSGCAIVFLGL
jgi:nickel/cobalt transporter (NicO) family protein